MGERSAFERFGGARGWKGVGLSLGEAITGEGPGEGFAMIPWALDKYERALDLRDGESWLLRRLLKHAWEYEQPVFVSFRRISRESGVSRTTLTARMRRLVQLGYAECVSEGKGFDRRKRYDVSGIYAALAICIAADPTSNWAKARGRPLSIETARRLVGKGGRRAFSIDFEALADLASMEGDELTEEEEVTGQNRPEDDLAADDDVRAWVERLTERTVQVRGRSYRYSLAGHNSARPPGEVESVAGD